MPRTKSAPKAMKRAKKAVAKQRKARAKKGMDTFFLQARTTLGIRPVQGTTVANYLYQAFNLLDPAGASGQGAWCLQNIPEFKLYTTLYDKVRVNSVTVRLTPKANVLGQDAAQNDTALNVSGDGMIHTAIDRDSVAPSNIAQLRKYTTYKGYSLLKKFVRSYAITWPSGVWLDCQNLWSDMTLLQRLGAFGSVTMYAENVLEDNLEIFNEIFANVELIYNCVFQGKNSAAVSYDPDTGACTVTPHSLIPNKTPSEVVLYGVDVTDNSGNLIRGNVNNQ